LSQGKIQRRHCIGQKYTSVLHARKYCRSEQQQSAAVLLIVFRSHNPRIIYRVARIPFPVRPHLTNRNPTKDYTDGLKHALDNDEYLLAVFNDMVSLAQGLTYEASISWFRAGYSSVVYLGCCWSIGKAC
jgi:high-affinity nickel permease